jgi:hypothetical protein
MGITRIKGAMMLRAMICAVALLAFTSSSSFAACSKDASGQVKCDGQGRGGDNQGVRSGSTSETNDRGVTTTQTSRGGEVKTKDGKGVVTTPGGKTCAKTANNQGCR